jgi:hypothetical protein
LQSKEKNFNNRKVMFYTLITDSDRQQVYHMRQTRVDCTLTFQ